MTEERYVKPPDNKFPASREIRIYCGSCGRDYIIPGAINTVSINCQCGSEVDYARFIGGEVNVSTLWHLDE